MKNGSIIHIIPMILVIPIIHFILMIPMIPICQDSFCLDLLVRISFCQDSLFGLLLSGFFLFGFFCLDSFGQDFSCQSFFCLIFLVGISFCQDSLFGLLLSCFFFCLDFFVWIRLVRIVSVKVVSVWIFWSDFLSVSIRHQTMPG